MKFTFLQIAVLATLTFPVGALAQGTVRGAQEGAAGATETRVRWELWLAGRSVWSPEQSAGFSGSTIAPVSMNMSHTRSTRRTTTAICELERFCRQTE